MRSWASCLISSIIAVVTDAKNVDAAQEVTDCLE
jgi:hypothetical protein